MFRISMAVHGFLGQEREIYENFRLKFCVFSDLVSSFPPERQNN